MKSNKIPCSNISTDSYTGKELSPKRFGLSAEGFDIGYKRVGYEKENHDINDYNEWCVQIRNGRKVWAKINNITKITPEEPLLTSLNHIINNDDNIVNTNLNNDVVATSSVESSEDVAIETTKEVKIEKKRTDYNIFIKYYLDKLKSENKDNTPHKILFQATTLEWNRLKKNPDELKILMDNIKK
jgi:hypothetical protein